MEQNSGQKQLAIEAYDKGIAVAKKSIDSSTETAQAKTALGQMLSAEGNIYVTMKKFDQAIGSFSNAVEVDSYPALDYFNLWAAYYDINRHEAAVAACDKAIASDPKLPDPYFVKASVLYGQGRLEHGKFIAPPSVAESLNQYLALDPNGPHANDAREMLAKLGSEVETTYKTRKK